MANAKDNEKTPDVVFNIGEVINGYTLVNKIDEGGFGQVFKCTKDKEFYAIKLEASSMEGGSAIKLEISVLQGLPHDSVFPAMMNGGRKPKFHFLVLELLGDNLRTLKSKSPNPDVFSDGTWTRLAIQCMFALKQMHDAGFLHRDVKPNNFAIGIGPAKCRRIYLFDFGLARKFIIKEILKPAVTSKQSAITAQTAGEPPRLRGPASKNARPRSFVPSRTMKANNQAVDMRPVTVKYRFRKPRPHTDFRGTELYASPNAHDLKELGRADDIWSMLYMVAEFFKDLPWNVQDTMPTDVVKNQCTMLRVFADDANPGRLQAPQVAQLESIEAMLKEKNYYQAPDYLMVYTFLSDMMKRSGVKWEDPYDWEKSPQAPPAPVQMSRKSAKVEKGPWEKGDAFFKVDVWRNLKVPEIANTPRTGRPSRSNGKGSRSMSKEDPSLNVEDDKESINQNKTPQRSLKKDSASVKQEEKKSSKPDGRSIYEVTSTKK